MSGSTIPWVIIRLGKKMLAIPSTNVMEMLVLPHLASIPNAPNYVRGVITLRDTVIPIVDFRMRLGMGSAAVEVESLIQLLHAREKDHRDWITELENSIKEGRDFKLSRDPHLCKFGQWYDNYKAPNLALENHLKKFNEPHKRIHALADEVCNLSGKGQKEKALETIEHEKGTTLALLVNLFEETRKLLRETLREIVTVLHYQGRTLGVTVDNIESVEYLNEDTIEPIPGLADVVQGEVINSTGRTTRQDKLVMLVDVHALFTSDKHTAGILEKVSDALPTA